MGDRMNKNAHLGESGASRDLQALDSGSCLIAGILELNYHHPQYWDAYSIGDGRFASVDMVRIKLRMMPGGAVTLTTSKDRDDGGFLSVEYREKPNVWTAKARPGSWHEIWSWPCGDSSVTFGWGLALRYGKIDESTAFVEFNPNKVAGDPLLWRLLDAISRYACKASLVRFDLAYDIPAAKNDCHVTKDGRVYKCVIGKSMTEYLGVKNTPGYVKVYDKAAEAGLSEGPLTRIELTCDGEWDAAKIVGKKWPQVHAWTELADDAEGVSDKTKSWMRVLGLALSELANNGYHDVESLVNMLERHGARKKVREYLRDAFVVLPMAAAESCIAEAHSWCESIAPTDAATETAAEAAARAAAWRKLMDAEAASTSSIESEE